MVALTMLRENARWEFSRQVRLHLKLSQLKGSLHTRVANLWTEFASHEGEGLIANGKEPENPNKLVVAATCEMAKT